MLRTTLLLFAVSITISLHAQLYIPRDVKQAYDRKERSVDGRPAKSYWQNHARYNINVSVDPRKRSITGNEEIMYINNSPIELSYLNYRLIQNIHRAGVQRGYDIDTAYLTSGIHIDSFSINGETQAWTEPTASLTYKWINLPKPLASKDSVKIFFKWHYTISAKAVREGMLDSTSCFLAYFYPRVAVVDDYNWWDWMDFTDVQEFYNDFSDYTLNVTVPENYVVWATGTLQNINEVLQPVYSDRLSRSFMTDSVIRVAGKEEMAEHKVTKQNKYNTWQWKASWIPDVAFGVSDHFAWDAASVEVVPGRRVSVQALYNDTIAHFHTAVKTGQHALKWFSNNWPGIAYPYPKMTVSSGFDDMEYPMMANDLPGKDPDASTLVEMHEIVHSWFPFFMGINESRYPFMDEGWATAFEYLISRDDYGVQQADSVFKEERVKSWINDPLSLHDLPIITPADALKSVSYGDNAYGKAALAYLALKEVLGDVMFKKCLHEFIDRWHGKHPIPWDFFYTFNDVAGNLDWFWNNWFFSNGYIDIALKKVVKVTGGYTITINNTGGFYIPFSIAVNYSDGSKQLIHQTPVAWQAGKGSINFQLRTTKQVSAVDLQTGIYMDANEENNKWPVKK